MLLTTGEHWTLVQSNTTDAISAKILENVDIIHKEGIANSLPNVLAAMDSFNSVLQWTKNPTGKGTGIEVFLTDSTTSPVPELAAIKSITEFSVKLENVKEKSKVPTEEMD